MEPNNKPWTKADLMDMDTSGLKALLRQDLEADDADALPAELLEDITVILQDREKAAGTYHSADADNAWQFFRDHHLQTTLIPNQQVIPFPGDGQRGRRPLGKATLRKLAAVAVIAAVLFAGTLTAWAIGSNIWGAIARWNEDKFHFEVYGSSSNSESVDTTPIPKEEFIAEAEMLLPTWIPDGYEISESKVMHNGSGISYYTAYTNNENGFFSMDFSKYYNPETVNSLTFEKSEEPIETYERGDACFYIMHNLNTMTASWSDGQRVVILAGSLTKEELKAMIDSIGGFS